MHLHPLIHTPLASERQLDLLRDGAQPRVARPPTPSERRRPRRLQTIRVAVARARL